MKKFNNNVDGILEIQQEQADDILENIKNKAYDLDDFNQAADLLEQTQNLVEKLSVIVNLLAYEDMEE